MPNFQFRTNLPFNFPHFTDCPGLPNSRLQTPTPSTSPEGTTTTALSKLQQPTTRPPRRRSQLIPDDALSLLAHGQLLSIVQSTALRHPDVLNAFRTNSHLRFSAGLLYYAASGYWISGYCGLKVVFAGVLLVSSPAPFVVVDFCVFRRCRRFYRLNLGNTEHSEDLNIEVSSSKLILHQIFCQRQE
ncbi:hypothetical protein RHMOL_Rhmol05G0297200 [Rhododendron molle]|uniref:Uncharacterized protein n=6 Tax=Rhododendron molle TaxID=49168 RepID=A0ACC0NUI5_RHOML|nr:hypothetical protein RHMOL_Rhmol05G0297200 [Rhododendron molle]KAI8556956.1 hypothetical protein RHMOL_Rhmol05G0297200 [Rhododendron molle]KAI8556958.1 hypothetical protein RHMOL_Rhmol05G0297200 [Rhododendron molle]KAI8556961.1 hypothetical protein RHMOL_Rhmol05G0297200 [Rhododendron molle]KAI8556962.1 hypothetical protein RHMOL_Rhmol05G0297200 [Rhododendron molle]